MWIPSFISSLVKHVDPETSRYALGCVLVEHWSEHSMTRYTATDAKQVIFVTKPSDTMGDELEESAGRFSRVLIDGSSFAAAAKAAATGVKRGYLALCEVSKALAVRCFQNERFTSRGKITAEVELGSGRFPDCVSLCGNMLERLTDGNEEYHTTLLNATYLKQYCETVIAAHKNAGSEPIVRLFVPRATDVDGLPHVTDKSPLVAFTQTPNDEAIHWVCCQLVPEDDEAWTAKVQISDVLGTVEMKTKDEDTLTAENKEGLDGAA